MQIGTSVLPRHEGLLVTGELVDMPGAGQKKHIAYGAPNMPPNAARQMRPLEDCGHALRRGLIAAKGTASERGAARLAH